jgi:pimeloyl-ACP methyl ester carboxylesterase
MPYSLRAGVFVALAFLCGALSESARGQKAPPIEKRSGHLDVGGSRIYYEECGMGAGVVLLHDGLIHSATWDAEWEPLCRKYHAVRYDRRGYGKSDSPKSQFSQVEDLGALLAHLNIGRAVLVGSSSGAAIAVDFSLAHASMVEGLLLIAPMVDGMQAETASEQVTAKDDAPLAAEDMKAAAERWSKDRNVLGEGHEAARKKLYDILVENPQNLKYTGEFEIHNSSPASSHLAEIRVPTLILVGEFDTSDAHSRAAAIEDGIPGAQRDVIINAGHLVQLEEPDILIEKVSRFVDLQERKSVDVPVETLHGYTGQYNGGEGVVTIGLQDGHLTMQLPGQSAFPLYAESASKFFLRVSEIEIEFTKDAAGKVKQALIDQDGATTKAPRLPSSGVPR